MFETMDNAEGVGLAAPQIGLPIRVVTINLDVLFDDLPYYKDFARRISMPIFWKCPVRKFLWTRVA